MKKITALILFILMLCPSSTFADGISVYVNSERVEFDASPKIINSRTMVPVRAVFEKLGAAVSWDADTKTVYITDEEKSTPRWYRVYENASYSILYPDGWNIDISYGNIIFIDNQGDITHSDGLGMILLSEADFINDSFTDTVSAKYDYLISDCGAELSEFKNTEVNGCAAAVFKYRDSDGDFISSYIISGSDRAYFIEFLSQADGIFDELYQNTLYSFAILK